MASTKLILITGATGSIGGRLWPLLAADGERLLIRQPAVNRLI